MEVGYEDGKSVSAKFYKNGKLAGESDGISTEYFGKPLPIGIAKTYDENGQLSLVIDFGKELRINFNGQPQGEVLCQGVEDCKNYK